jgi:hypothetical protein
MSDDPAFDIQDVDRDGIPDMLDTQIDPAPLDQMTADLAPLNEPSTEEALLELQAQKQRESLMTSTLTNIANMKHESLKKIADNLRG